MAPRSKTGGKRKCPSEKRECRKDNGRSADRIARVLKGLAAEAKFLEHLVILVNVVAFQVVEKLAAAARKLEQTTATMEILAMSAKVFGEMVNTSRQQSDLDFGRTGILVVSFVSGDDFWFYYGRHGLVFKLHDCRSPLQGPCRPLTLLKSKLSRRHRSNPTGAGPVMVEVRNRRTFTHASSLISQITILGARLFYEFSVARC